MDLNRKKSFNDPLTIQLCDNQKIPFKVIVGCQKQELALNTYQRPITQNDNFLFEFINERNLKYLAIDIENFKIQLQQEKINKGNIEDRFQASCKIFFGEGFLKPSNGKRQQENQQYFKTQLLQNQANFQERAELSNNRLLHTNGIGTLREQSDQPLIQDTIYQSQSKKTLVCGVYENESSSQIKAFINSFKDQDANLVILCNGIDSLNSELKEELFQKKALIQRELEKNLYSVNNALVLQYDQNDANFPRVIFIIKYYKSSNFDIQKWIYNGIGNLFDPDYYYVTQCCLIQSTDSVRIQINQITNQNVCAITNNFLNNKTSSWNPFNPNSSFLLEQTIDEIQNISTNKLFSFSLDHNPFFCFYNWQDVKQFIDSYLQKIINSECDYVQNIISQGPNYILPSLAAEKGLFFGRSEQIVAMTSQNDSLSKFMNEQRKRKNSKSYAYDQFFKAYNQQSSNWQISPFTKFIQQIALKVILIQTTLSNFFSISAILFIFAQSSYDFFGNGFDYYYLYILQLSIPSLFIFSLVIFLIFAILFRSQYKIARAKGAKDPILFNGSLIIQITENSFGNSCQYLIENLEKTSILKRNQLELDYKNIKLVGSFSQQKVLNLFLHYEKSIYCVSQNITNSILNSIYQEASKSEQYQRINQRQSIEYFARIDVQDLFFNYQNEADEAAVQFNVLFYFMAIFNFIMLLLFVLNLVFNHYIKVDEDSYSIIIWLCIVIVLLEKIMKMITYSSHLQIFVKGYFSYLFYYLVVSFGMRFYERINTDNNVENEKLKQFYYVKVQSFAIWITCNFIFLFICYMIEAYYNFCGYVLLTFLFYYAVISFISIILNLITKFFCFNLKNQKQESNQAKEESKPLYREQFELGSLSNYEDQFIEIQKEAHTYFNEQNEIKLDFEKAKLQSLKFEITKKFENQIPLQAVKEESSLLQSLQNSTSQFENRNQSFINSQNKNQAFQLNYNQIDDDNDSMLQSKRVD